MPTSVCGIPSTTSVRLPSRSVISIGWRRYLMPGSNLSNHSSMIAITLWQYIRIFRNWESLPTGRAGRLREITVLSETQVRGAPASGIRSRATTLDVALVFSRGKS
jgi:hypothetical protein